MTRVFQSLLYQDRVAGLYESQFEDFLLWLILHTFLVGGDVLEQHMPRLKEWQSRLTSGDTGGHFLKSEVTYVS